MEMNQIVNVKLVEVTIGHFIRRWSINPTFSTWPKFDQTLKFAQIFLALSNLTP